MSKPTTKERLLLSSSLFNVFFFILISCLAALSHAESERADFDLDDDGLIEINDIADLDEIRNHPDGKALYGKNEGCPDAEEGTINGGCFGFELTKDLDFDTNQDGEISELDEYWNDGYGWDPISELSATFNGNFFSINNLWIGPRRMNGALFMSINNADVSALQITGPLTSVNPSHFGAALALTTKDSKISDIQIQANIRSSYVGGIVKTAQNSSIKRVFVTGSITGRDAGGVLSSSTNSEIEDCFVSAAIYGESAAGGIFARGYSPNSTVNRCIITSRITGSGILSTIAYDRVNSQRTHVARDITGHIFDVSRFSSLHQSLGNTTLKELQCPLTANNFHCSYNQIYEGWDQAVNSNGDSLWRFGRSNQLPAMALSQSLIIKDSDGDGITNELDAFPLHWASSIDHDKDNYPDKWKDGCNVDCQASSGLRYDAFPNDINLAVDSDLDGIADVLNHEFCNSDCQYTSNYQLDSFPNDFDNDGISDLEDIDDNNDGFSDVDADSNGLIEINSWHELSAIRFQLDGSGLRLNSNGGLDQSGCPPTNRNGSYIKQCKGYELKTSLDFDTNGDQAFTNEDTFWNDANGWTPLASYGRPFKAIFDGNNYTIKNLVSKGDGYSNSLFGYIEGSEIRNLYMNGPLTYVTNGGGLIAILADNSKLENIYLHGKIEGSGLMLGGGRGLLINKIFTSGELTNSSNGGIAGSLRSSILRSSASIAEIYGKSAGLVSDLYGSIIENSFYNGQSHYYWGVSGLARYSEFSQIKNSFVSANTINERVFKGLVGTVGYTRFENSYWATDPASLYKGYGGENPYITPAVVGEFYGATETELRCATQATDTECSSVTLFEDWDKALDSNQNPIWDFGNEEQLPALIANDLVMRDSDGDGIFDYLDKFPSHSEAYLDEDDDGFPDRWNKECDTDCASASTLRLDAFPIDPTVAIDTDLDGFPDQWNLEHCGWYCQSQSEYTIDPYIFDRDNDGIPDDLDLDDNNDGKVDADADGDGLIDIFTLDLLDAIRYQVDGAGLRLSKESTLDQSGCPKIVEDQIEIIKCHGYELITDLDFDTNNDGFIDVNDRFWNDGKGWLSFNYPDNYLGFTSTFNGNGHSIRNLYSNVQRGGAGLFGRLRDAHVHSFSINGPLTKIDSGYTGQAVASLASYSQDSIVERVHSNAIIGGEYRIQKAGGLIGSAQNTKIKDSFFTGVVNESFVSGGIIGSATGSNLIENSFSTAYVRELETNGGIAGDVVGSLALQNSHWAMDTSTQLGISGESDFNQGHIGNLINELKCPTNNSESNCAINELFKEWNIDGTHWDFGTTDQLPGLVFGDRVIRDSDGDRLLDEEDEYPLVSIIGYTDTDSDGAPDTCDSVCQASGMSADLDNDNDGVPNTQDQKPLISHRWLEDLDQDGLPNKCESECLGWGLTEDLDDDGDNVPDEQDFYPLISLNGLTDTDQDGIPNKCDLDCIALGMSEDLDDDNDAIPDLLDGFPEVAIGELTDTDGDGRPDECDDACLALGMKADDDDDNDQVPDGLDKFQLDPTEHFDTDLDGIGNNADTDDDNDGVLDELDPDINQDNGKPTLTKAPVNRELSADESGITVTIDSIDLLNELAAIDALDANPTFKASFNSQTVYLNQVESITLNTGLNTIHWYAMDESENLSEPQTQTIKVYPKVGFVSEKVVTGETSEASIAINLSGESPIYPIELTVAIDVDNSTVNQKDFVQGQFDLTANHIVTIEKQEGRLQNTQAELIIPLLNDLEVEQEEVLTLKLIAVHSGNLELPLMQITDSHKKMELVVTDENLPPSLNIEVFQDGQKINGEEIIVDINGGQLDFKASSIDPNGDPVHYEWKLEGLTMTLEQDTTTWSIDPSRFVENESYALEVTAIDSSDSSIRTSIRLDFKTIDSIDDNSDEEETIGSVTAFWLLMLFSLFRKRGIYKK